MHRPLLQYYSDGTFGYDLWDEKDKLHAKQEILEEQQPEESREDFFNRVGVRPKINMYGSDFTMDEQCNDENWKVRWNVAYKGYGLGKLIDDEDWRIRGAVAEQGYRLDILINDREEFVRAAVAAQKYELNKLINDENYNVRVAVARQGYGLDRLIDDEDGEVRATVAKQGYGFDKLINDFYIRKHCEKYLKDIYPSKTIEEALQLWIKENPDKCALPENRI